MNTKIKILALGIFTLLSNISCGQKANNQKDSKKMNQEKVNLD